ncbi:cytochrome P450, partial [Mycena leptocephala]
CLAVGRTFGSFTQQLWVNSQRGSVSRGTFSSSGCYGRASIRSTTPTDRPFLQLGGELVGFRNLFHQLFGTSMAIERFLPLLRSEIRKFLQNLLLNPDGAEGETQRTAAAVTIRIAYGYRIGAERDHFLELSHLRSKIFTESTQSTALMIDRDIVRYFPAWLPGGGFRITANKWAKVIQDSVNGPFGYVKDQMVSYRPDEIPEQPDDDYLVKWAASSIFGAGTSTTSSQPEGFFLAMSLYPAVQAEAQRELERVIGKYRLPDEVLRWHNATPTGKQLRIHHSALELYRDSPPDSRGFYL